MPLSEAKKRNNIKWDAKNLKRMSLAVPVRLYERMQAHIEKNGGSMNKFIKEAIEKALDAPPDGGD
ncbi:MAG: hypothetical protein IKF99_02915 [Oscillospiraceae bacterium]|nr:hypothetical protein [Oscillospiraceae bacterium]